MSDDNQFPREQEPRISTDRDTLISALEAVDRQWSRQLQSQQPKFPTLAVIGLLSAVASSVLLILSLTAVLPTLPTFPISFLSAGVGQLCLRKSWSYVSGTLFVILGVLGLVAYFVSL